MSQLDGLRIGLTGVKNLYSAEQLSKVDNHN